MFNIKEFKIKLFLIILLILELYNNNNKRMKIALCVVVKKERKYLEEFINYYLILGINKIFLYDNNDVDGEKYDDILKKYIKKKIVQIINFRGLIKPQKLAFTKCYNNNKYNYDWFSFYDVDEYLYLYKYKKLNKFLASDKFKKCSSILINWKFYGDNNHSFYEPKPLKERFIKPFDYSKNCTDDKYLYAAGKSIVRGGLNITWLHFPHILKNKNRCGPNGKLKLNPWSYPNFSFAFIKHYATKSAEEFADKLLKGTVNSLNTSSKSYYIKKINN